MHDEKVKTNLPLFWGCFGLWAFFPRLSWALGHFFTPKLFQAAFFGDVLGFQLVFWDVLGLSQIILVFGTLFFFFNLIFCSCFGLLFYFIFGFFGGFFPRLFGLFSLDMATCINSSQTQRRFCQQFGSVMPNFWLSKLSSLI